MRGERNSVGFIRVDSTHRKELAQELLHQATRLFWFTKDDFCLEWRYSFILF